MNYRNLVLVLFGLSTTLIYQNVEAKLDGESIVGGNHAIPGQLKYQVSIQVNKHHICGGGIIANKYVLTAAHCVINDNGEFEHDQLEILAGAIRSNKWDSSAVRVKVEKAYVPTEYDPVNPYPDRPYRDIGDIAVLKLKEGLRLRANPTLRKLKLPAKVGGKYPTYTNKNAVIAGYGDNWVIMRRIHKSTAKTEVASGSSRKLKFAETTVISKASCSSMFRNPVYDEHICAAVIQRDPRHPAGICSGDSGGPLVFNGDTVIGVVSFSPTGCTEEKYASVYTRVSSYKSFIQNAIKDVKTNEMRLAEWTEKSKDLNLSGESIVFSES